MALETVIGLEIHVELKTKSKIFCSCSTHFGDQPNQNTCPICLGLPGTLPVLNESVVNLAIKAGKVLNGTINKINKFDRKNYFYPDLPKAYQISQFELPICEGGYIDIEVDGSNKRIHLTRIHLEEDAGKLIHDDYDPISMVDYNRTGVPLIEIVTEPEISTAEEAMLFLKSLKGILEYANISDCKMEQGSLRCDANISLREVGTDVLNTKVEIKNMNSFKEIAKALTKEEMRQRELYSFNEQDQIVQETRKWDSGKGRTITMRGKEDAHDYRYFSEPDLSKVIIEEQLINEINAEIPELPAEKKMRFQQQYGLTPNAIDILVDSKPLADYFESVITYKTNPIDASNWIIVEILRLLKKDHYDTIPIKPQDLAEIINLVNSKKINHALGKEVLALVAKEKKSPRTIIKEQNLNQINEQSILYEAIEQVIQEHPEAVEDYQSGELKALDYLMGQVMRSTKGKANPTITKEILKQKLD